MFSVKKCIMRTEVNEHCKQITINDSTIQKIVLNLQKECLCYFIMSSTSLWRNHFNQTLL